VVDAVHANQSGIFEFRSIISSIKLLLNFNSSFEVKLIKRKANLTAHTLGFFFFLWWEYYGDYLFLKAQ
jgi:hypothetical protein